MEEIRSIKGEKKQKFNEFSLNLNFGKRNGEMKGFGKRERFLQPSISKRNQDFKPRVWNSLGTRYRPASATVITKGVI